MLYKDKGDLEKGSEVINQGKAVFPGNTDLVITEANMYISTNNHAKAINSLMVAKEKEPNNVSVLYAVGVTYDLLKNDTKLPADEREKYFNEAVKAYKETIAVDPNFFDAVFNLGALYFNKGGEVINEANKLPISETAKYEKMLAEGNSYLNLALPYLETCETLQPKDKNTLVSLKEIYTRLNMTQKLAGINEKLNNL
jgi:tetratricopeptide (TPR) repeat protein